MLKKLASNKQSSLLSRIVRNKEKRFYKIETCGQFIKLIMAVIFEWS
jgi:hypothetical protein